MARFNPFSSPERFGFGSQTDFGFPSRPPHPPRQTSFDRQRRTIRGLNREGSAAFFPTSEENQELLDNPSFTDATVDFSQNRDSRRQSFADDPSFAFQTILNQSGLGRNELDLLRSETGDFLSRFQGALGNQLDTLGRSDLNPLDFFRGINLQQELQRRSPQGRGESNAGLSRASRILF